MLLTTTPIVEGSPIREYRGVVTSEVIVGANFVILVSGKNIAIGESRRDDRL